MAPPELAQAMMIRQLCPFENFTLPVHPQALFNSSTCDDDPDGQRHGHDALTPRTSPEEK
jgi:hypothetical protein